MKIQRVEKEVKMGEKGDSVSSREKKGSGREREHELVVKERERVRDGANVWGSIRHRLSMYTGKRVRELQREREREMENERKRWREGRRE